MELNFIDHRPDIGRCKQIQQVVRQKIRHADGAQDTLIIQPLHGAPRVAVELPPGVAVPLLRGPMDQIEIEIVGFQAAHRLLRVIEQPVVPEIVLRDLGRQKQRLPRHAGRLDRRAEHLLIAVEHRRIKAAVAAAQRLFQYGLSQLVGRMIRAETDHRNADAIGKYSIIHKYHDPFRAMFVPFQDTIFLWNCKY